MVAKDFASPPSIDRLAFEPFGHYESEMAVAADTFELRFVGARFDGGRIPLDVLPDLSAFRDLVISLAKSRWLREHPLRRRLPRGFNHSVSFDLIDVKDGSAAPQLQWNRFIASQNAPELVDEMSRLLNSSYEEAAQLFNQAGADRFPTALPPEQIAALNRFGSSLRPTEKIEFVGQNDSQGNVIFLDVVRRRRLITQVSDTYTKRFQGSGILKASSSDGWIVVETDLGKLTISIPSPIVIDHYDGNLEAEVQFELLIELDSNDVFRRIIECLDVTIVDASDAEEYRAAMSRINSLRLLEKGWLDGEGAPIEQAAVRVARSILYQRPGIATLKLGVFPTEEGGITLEFRVHGWDYNIEVMPTGHLEVYGIEVDGIGSLEPLPFDSFSDDMKTTLDGKIGQPSRNG